MTFCHGSQWRKFRQQHFRFSDYINVGLLVLDCSYWKHDVIDTNHSPYTTFTTLRKYPIADKNESRLYVTTEAI